MGKQAGGRTGGRGQAGAGWESRRTDGRAGKQEDGRAGRQKGERTSEWAGSEGGKFKQAGGRAGGREDGRASRRERTERRGDWTGGMASEQRAALIGCCMRLHNYLGRSMSLVTTLVVEPGAEELDDAVSGRNCPAEVSKSNVISAA